MVKKPTKPRRIEDRPFPRSTMETIDTALNRFIDETLDINCVTTTGFRKVPSPTGKWFRDLWKLYSDEYKKLGKRWWIKRSEAYSFFFYLKKKYKRQYSLSLDFFVTKMISKILQ